ncbi:PREDICTED: A-kinase anchor protein 9 isoform X5 [Gekko japonicus]|uniref:A-kinase anchor protein 9 isoform X5 n=1 Tax=Gekko japonicus TaxID=146911 RepID=A0ABM1JRN9_GEKJA|nr:PREDICTED: A-kinase anchor protein 9 isoform X5 [Gekko japonicus]
MEDEERQKKLEAGKAKLAQFRQRKAHADGQNATKKQKKKKKVSNTKDEELVQEGLDIDQSQGEDTYTHSCERGAVATPDFAIVRTLHSSEMIKHDQTYTTELESEISTTADDYSSEVNGCSFLTKTEVPADFIREEEFGFGENYSELGMQHSLTRLEMVENELAGKQQEIEELNRELEEMRAAYGTEGLQQLQEFEAAIKKRDDIITQLTANLQQARKEKDETMKEFLDLTEQSQKLQIQFQHLQASEALRNTSHSSTAADLLQTKQQILAYQQQLEEQEQVLRSYQMKNEDYEMQVSLLQQRIAGLEMERRHVTEEDSIKKKLQEKETIIEKLEAKIREEEENIVGLQKKVSVAEKSVEELKEEVLQKNREVHNVRVELASSKQKEKQCSDEIKQLMGTVEELQKRCHKDSQLEKDIMQRMEHEAQRRLEDLRAELEEVHGQQIVHMKQELVREHTIEIEKLLAQQKADLERTLNLGSGNANEDQIHLMNIAINELNMMLQDANYQREKTRQDFSQQLEEVTSEKSSLKSQIEDLCQELSLAREQIQRAQRTINEKDTKLHDSEELLMSVGDLKAELASAVEIQKELEIKHEAEITNYKIKLEMLEREKDAVLDRMAESQEAELERLRTQLLFSHEEELSKLRDDLLQEHRINTENLKDNLHMKHRQQLDGLQNEMTKKIEAMKSENDDLTVKQTQLTLEISRLKDLQQAMANSKSEEMRLQIHELQKEVDILRQEKKEKGMLEQEVQELQLKIESLKKQMKEREADLQEKCTLLETQNVVLEDENNALQEKFKKYAVMNIEETLIIDNISPNSQDFGLQNRIDDLIAENERLVKQEIVLKEEIEKQRNSLSFAEKNFEHNYQELREEYVSILKVKSDLEKSKNEQEAEYKARLQAFTEEIQNLQRDMPVTHKARSSVLHGKREKILRSETFDIEEVVEKETTELMEKLEVTHREKLELSLKLSDLSEELKLKDSEICQLSEEIQSLKRDKDCISVKCKELELILSHRQGENMKTCEHKPYSNGGTQVDPTTFSEPGSLISDSCKEYDSTVTEREEKRTPSNSMVLHIPVEEAIQQNLNPEPLLLLDNLQHMSAELAADPSRMSLVQSENKLQDQLDLLKSEQSDLKLQMEAQRICLSLVYSAHVDQVREYMENEKQTALSSLKEELQVRHAQELCEVKKNQMDYQATKEQKPDGDGRSVSVRLEGLSKTVAEECSKINQSLRSVLHEKPSIALEDDAGEREKSSTVLISRTEAQALERTLQTVLSKILEEHHNLLEYHAQLLKDITRVEELNLSHADHDEREIGNVQQNLGYLHMPSQDLVDFKVSQSHWEDMEKFKSQLEEQHAQEVEHLRSYYHQQLKETEERCTTEIAHMQSKLQDARVPSECFSICKKSQANEMLQKGKHAESGLQEIAEKSTELSNEVGMIEFLEKQYQEKLLEEIAKVVVTMSVQFAQKNELERIANLKGDDMLMGNNLRSGKECPEELDSCRDERIGTKYEATKSLSMEISEEYSETASTDRQFQPDVKSALVPGQHELDSMSPADSSSSVKELMQNTSLITSEDSISSTVSSKQVLLYEERLEDMRQELVRQYQEHQQATEMLKQGHMQQMEWQKENQELLQAELDRLKAQLAENIALDSDHIITEREQMLIEELELLKKQLTPEREMLSSELKTCSTQTQRENINETESKECVLEGEDGGGNHNEASSDIFSKERHGLQKANNRLLKILLEVVKTVVAVEETIGCHVVGLLDWSSKCQLPCRSLSWEAKTEDLKKTSVRVGYEAENSFSSYHGSNLEGDVSNIWSEVTDENLVVSQYLTEHGFSGVEMDSENQELVLNISFRLQAAVEKLLEAINETTNQLEHARVTQTELMRESFKREQEATELLKSQEDLQERLDEEVKARQQLALELGRAESLIDGYADEKSLLEKQIQEKTDVIEHLEQDLLCTGNKLQELEAERQQLQEEKELLFRQKDAMKADAGPIEQRLVDAAVDAASQAELLAETEKLMKEKIEVQRQAEKEYDYLQKQVKVLEADIEEQVNRLLELEQEKNAELMDLRQQNQALEKQLEKTKKFLDEQAIDREHERDVFQQEIQKLEHQLKIPQRFQPVNEHQNREVIEGKNDHIKELEAQIEYLKSDQERVKQNSEQEIEQLNEVIEKLQQELANIEHKEPLDFSLIQEDADNLKHQLDVVFAEKEVLLKKVESSDVEVSRAKNELEETKLKVKKLKEELDALRESHKRMGEELENVQMRSGVAEVRGKLSEKPVNKKKTKIFNSVDENAKDSLINIDTKLQQLQTVLKEKDLELKQCYKQIKDLNEQAKVESEAFQQKIAELEETLAQKAAAALVIEAQLNAVLEQSKVLPEMHTGGPEEAIQTIQTEKVDSTVEEDAKLRLSALLEKLTEMERQVANAHSNLQLEKAKVEIAQKEAKEKEGRLTELQQLLAATEEKHKRERTKISKKTKAPQMVPEQSANKQRRLLPDDRELEKVRAESVAAKEELNSCQEKAEKMKEELMVKEASVIRLQEELKQTRGKLSQVEEKLAVYVQKEESPNKLERVCTKEESAVNRTNASCQTHKTVLINSCNQTLQLPTKNEEIQIDLQNGCSSEEVAEIIREFSEKIDQMQELHAAEIMDMETRHISESEALKREQFILVQELTEECNSLKAVIETLRDKEGIPSLSQSVSSNARDGCSSDSSSDWSQGVYLAPSLGSDTVSEEIGNEDESSADFLPKKIKGLLRAVHHEGIQVLNLTEFPCSDSDVPSLKQGAEYWMQERKAFLSTVSALKDLIAKMQVHGDPELYAGSEPSGGISDWRSELLFAVQQVFQREKDVLLAVFQTELAEGGTRDVVALIGQLEKRLQEQGTYQRTAVDCIQNADRISLLMEVKWLHSQLNNRRTDSKREAEIEPNCQELLGCNMEMQMELSNTKDKAAELQEQLNSERMMVAELNNGFGQAKLELETTLKAQHKHLRDLEAIRNELKVKTAELDMLKDTLASEQKKSRELQWTLEKEKAKMERSEGRGREELEDLKYSLEHEKQKVIELNNFLEFEKQLSSNLEKKVQSQEALNAAQLSQERSCNSELQVLLESERFRVLELSSALERGKELCAQLQAAEQKRHDGTLKPAEELLGDLQKQLDEKHGRIVELVSEMERYKLESVQLKQQMEKEKQIQRNTLQAEQEAHLLAQKKVNELESKVEDLQWQLEEKRQQVHQLQCEEKKVQEIIQELQQEQRKEAGAKAEIATHQNLNEATWDTSNERTRKWVFQQKMGAAETKELSCSSLIGMGGGDVIKESQNLQAAREKLRNVSSKLKLLANKAVNRLPFEKTDDEDFVGIQNDIEEVLLHLQMSSGFSSLEAELNSELPPFSSLTERLLKQNAELTGFVSRLSEEKNNLRNVIMKLEEELRRFQHRGPCGDSPFRPSLCNGGNTGALISSEGEIWKREKLTLQQSLKDAEAELVKLRAELRNEAFLRELGSDSENAALKRIYGRYLRAESFRKALIYQKKYLLLLLGGFQECEEATLSLIARMGGQPSYTDLEVVTRRPKGFTRFRSAVRVLIAISRMKFLVHRWHRITGYSSVGTSRDGFSQNTVGNELSGGLELYGEQRPSSYRSRSELESLRSPLSYQHRYQGVHPDLSPVSLACSQLQNYDPDRALTDYINRLEALQKRLGTVQPAPASYAQLHSGIRR